MLDHSGERKGGADPQGADAALAIVTMVLDGRRSGTLHRAALYDVADDARGERNIRDCVAVTNGKVRDGARGGRLYGSTKQ
jgi:hypothetical protein